MAANFALATIELKPLQEQQVLVRNPFMSVDPYMRGRMNNRIPQLCAHSFANIFYLSLPGLRRISREREASRLAAMQRADRNINELLEGLQGVFHRLRQSGIDEELFDVIPGFEALAGE